MSRNIIRDIEPKREWESTREYCYLCGRKWSDLSVILDTAHIYGAASRSNEPCNLLRLSRDCHRRDHEGHGDRKLKKGHLLWLKKKHDPMEYNQKRLLELSCRATLPDLQEPER